MIYRFQSDYNNPLVNRHYVQYDSGLTDDQINRIIDIGSLFSKTNVKLYGEFDEQNVKATGSHFPLNSDTSWVYDEMANLAAKINANCFQYDLTGFHENFYFLSYEESDHFNWHLDIGLGTPAPRKLSLVLQLSDPKEYEGGDFDILVATDYLRVKKKKGLVTAFPSYKIHRVTPVTSGIRKTLTMFLTGPNFR